MKAENPCTGLSNEYETMEKYPPPSWKFEDHSDCKPSESVNPEENADSQVPSEEYH